MSEIVKINSEMLSNDIKNMDNVTVKLRELFEGIKSQTDSLKDVWVTRTSDEVYLDFEEFYKIGEVIVNTNDADARLLDNVVNSNYVNFEDKTDELINSNIAI